MNILAALLLTLTTTTLVLHSGDRLPVDGSITESNGMLTFRIDGTLYTMPASEVVRIDRGTSAPAPATGSTIVVSATGDKQRVPLAVPEARRRELLAALERNHSGQETPPFERVPQPSREEVRQQTQDEWSWKREARSYEENVRRAEEDLQLLYDRAAQLQQRIHSFVSQGYKPNQFTYDTTQLARTLERIPAAELQLQRAERALEQFRDDARRLGVMPGWLR